MINVNYELNVSPSVAETYLANSEFEDAQFFLKRDEGFSTLGVILADTIDFSSEVYAVTKTASKYKILTNTTDILATNIKVDNVDYYYIIKAIGSSVDYKSVILNSPIECISHQGNLYTNEILINYELKPGLFLHSIPVVDTSIATIKYRSKDIEITYPSKLGDLFFKCRTNTVVEPRLLNDSKIYIPSFYLKVGSSVLKCIEGDIKILAKQELSYFVGNSITCKDYIYEYDSNFYNTISNKIYVDFFNYKTTPALVSYKAKVSSHIFSFNNDTLYFKIKPTGLVLSNKSDFDFYVYKSFNIDKLSITESTYLTSYKHILNTNDYVLVNKPITNESEAVSLKSQISTNINKYPSEIAYVEYRNRYILQHTNNILPQDTTNLVEEDTYTDTHYAFNEPSSDIYSDYRFVKIGDTYYYKNSDNYYTVFLYEDNDHILLEDALNFLLEF